jgi:hypothetical protein
MLYVHFRLVRVYSKLRKREVGDWFAANKLQVGDEKRMV